MKSNIAIITLHNKPYYYVASLRIRLEQTFACDDSLLKNGQSAQWPNLTITWKRIQTLLKRILTFAFSIVSKYCKLMPLRSFVIFELAMSRHRKELRQSRTYRS